MLIASCSEPLPQTFDSERWKTGNKSVRGSMVKDINDSNMLKGKTKSEVVLILGKPDMEKVDGWVWSYEVITIPRCRFIWTCGMEIAFDPQTGKCTGGASVTD